MPLKRFCLKQGCNKLTSSGYCERHKQDKHQYDKYRGTPTERGYNHRWRKARRVYLSEHPLCVHCERDGNIVVATDLDHIQPHKGDQALFWDESNWQGLCKRHHSYKTVTEDGGFGDK